VLNRPLFNADDEIQEVVDSDTTSEQNTGEVVASTSSSEDPAATTTGKKISCPICLDDEKTVSKTLTLLRSTLYLVKYLSLLPYNMFEHFRMENIWLQVIKDLRWQSVVSLERL